jgi:DNA (cytosine-5)-methyltransferase 1
MKKYNVDNTLQSPTILSICTGMRGLERGLERVIGDITVAAYVEIEAFIIYNLVRQMEQGVVDAAPIWSDLKTFPSKEFHGKIHGIIGGYPCQPFSLAGKRAGESDERHLWPHIERLINAVRPLWCFFENVDDHLSLGFDTVYKSLRNMGYSVEAGIYTAQEAGAPHERARLYILAMDNSLCKQIKRDNQRGFYRLFNRASTELGNTNSNGNEEGNGLRRSEEKTAGNKVEENKRQRLWAELVPADKAVADTNYTGFGEFRRSEPVRKKQLSIECGSFKTWPAGQGQFQYEWEAPRAIKPGLGCTINGYNFRNDLLRMYGNGVVEQTAEIAIRDLLKKFNNPLM